MTVRVPGVADAVGERPHRRGLRPRRGCSSARCSPSSHRRSSTAAATTRPTVACTDTATCGVRTVCSWIGHEHAHAAGHVDRLQLLRDRLVRAQRHLDARVGAERIEQDEPVLDGPARRVGFVVAGRAGGEVPVGVGGRRARPEREVGRDSAPYSTTTSRENASTTTPPAGPSCARGRHVSPSPRPTATVCATGGRAVVGVHGHDGVGRVACRRSRSSTSARRAAPTPGARGRTTHSIACRRAGARRPGRPRRPTAPGPGSRCR